MLAWELVVEAQALRSQGWTVSAIARHLAWMHRCGMGLGWVVAAKCPVVVEE